MKKGTALFALLAIVGLLAVPRAARAQEVPPQVRPATLTWDHSLTELRMDFVFRDVLDAEVRRKLSRGLPTTIVLTAALYLEDAEKPVSTTAQTCKITWHVWNEAYRVETTHPEGSRTGWTTTVEGVLRRCAEAHSLLIATRAQVPSATVVSVKGRVQINPVSPEVLAKIKRWVSRPARTGTAAPGDALFSTFTGLFMRRIGEAERTLDFVTPPATPRVRPQPEKAESSEKEG